MASIFQALSDLVFSIAVKDKLIDCSIFKIWQILASQRIHFNLQCKIIRMQVTMNFHNLVGSIQAELLKTVTRIKLILRIFHCNFLFFFSCKQRKNIGFFKVPISSF